MHAFPRARGRALAVVFLVSLSAALFAMTARPQGVTATAKSVASSTPADVAAMKRRIDELERRVLELEKQKADQFEADKEDDAAAKKLEQRLAAVERAQQHDEAAERNNDKPGESENPSMVRAPFTVTDENGKPIFRIERNAQGDAWRMSLGNTNAAYAGLVVTNSGLSAFQIYDAAGQRSVLLQGSAQHSDFIVRGKFGGTYVGVGADGIPLMQVFNQARKPVVQMRGMESQSGLLIVSNAAGEALVTAGETTKGTGVVKTGPNGNGAAALLGNAGMAASEIQGKN